MKQANLKIREKAKNKSVYLWQIADALNVSDTAFSKFMRKELPDEKQREIFKIIDNIAAN